MRRLIICSDGTWKTPESKDVTNVVILAQAVQPVGDDGVQQLLFYDPGVGTGPFLDRLTGGAFGHGLSENIKQVYAWLIQNYAAGDQIFMFGFSRGAYTVRSAVGLIRKCGLLAKEHIDRVKAAYDLYRERHETPDSPAAVEFRARYSQGSVDIACLGVWDTVGSLGIPLVGLRALTLFPYRFHDTGLSPIVRRAFQAVAIDERRRSFEPTLWTSVAGPHQHIEQVWFAGVHSNVGGGYPDRGLSDIALSWMLDKARGAGLSFDEAYLQARLKPNEAGTLYNSLTGFYLLLGWNTRTMGEKPAEFVHATALARRANPALSYDPKALEEYFEKYTPAIVGEPTGPRYSR